MRQDPDVLIVGGGIVGLFCAYFLRLRGMSVAVLERGAIGGPQSCSYGNTGFVGTTGAMPLAEPGVFAQGLRWLLRPDSPFHVRPRLDGALAAWLLHFRRASTASRAAAGFRVLLEMKKRSLATFGELGALAELAPAYRADGKLIVFNTQQGFDKACKAAELPLAHGVPLRILSPAETRALEPRTRFEIRGAILNGEDGDLAAPDYVVRFARMLAGMGVDLYPRTEVTGFETVGREVTLVRTGRGGFRPREIVVAAGTWSADCVRALGIPLVMQPAKGYSITVSAPRNGPRLPVLLGEGKVAIAPLGDRLRFGGTLELVGMDEAVSPRRVAGIERTVRSYLPDLEWTAVEEVWSGFRPCTPDGIPYIGRADACRNVLLACGHGHVGMGLAPVTGKLVSQVVAGATPDMDLAPFRLDRFGWRAAPAAAAAAE